MADIPSLAALYEQRRYNNKIKRRERIDHIYQECPALKQVDYQINALTLKKGRARMKPSNTIDIAEINSQLQELNQKKQAILFTQEMEDNYLDEIYTCSDCHDTGYIDGNFCNCYLQWKADLLFRQSPIYSQMEKENFDTFDVSLYSDTIGPQSISPRENIKIVVDNAKTFVNTFPNCKNLLIHGTTGVGKTFLTNCIAKELLQHRYTVCYLSANNFFNVLSKHQFSKTSNTKLDEQYQFIQDCDLLIIDDLGTEIHSSFVDSALFEMINDRHKRDKRILISTNLTIKQLEENYSKRTVSRFIEQFYILPIFGKDIRLIKSKQV